MVSSGSTPDISVAEAKAMGYKIMIFPLGPISAAYGAIKHSLEVLRDKGELSPESKMGPKKLFEVVGLNDSLRIDAEAGGLSYTNGV